MSKCMKKYGIFVIVFILLLCCACSDQTIIVSAQWGFLNYGQSIKGTKGVKGIDINILDAWKITQGSSDIVVGVLDSGVQIESDFIKENIFINSKEIPGNGKDDDNNGFVDDINGWNFYNNDNKIYDNYLHDYHGTYICSLIASNKHGTMVGVAPNVKVMPLKFISGSKGQMDSVTNAIDYAYMMGVRIFNCSWDGTEFDASLKNTMEKYSDALFVCSGGKMMNDLEVRPVYPACYALPNVIAVMAIDNKGEIYEFSGYGSKADVAAPGVDIYGIMPDGDFTFASGTSSATAIVTGIAALVKSYRPTLDINNLVKILKEGTKPCLLYTSDAADEL